MQSRRPLGNILAPNTGAAIIKGYALNGYTPPPAIVYAQTKAATTLTASVTLCNAGAKAFAHLRLRLRLLLVLRSGIDPRLNKNNDLILPGPRLIIILYNIIYSMYYLSAAYLCCVVDLRVKINLYFFVQIYIVDYRNWRVRKKRSTSPNVNQISPLRSSCQAIKMHIQIAQFRLYG